MDSFEAKANRETLKFAVQRQIWCQFSGKILDVRTVVVIYTKDSGTAIMHQDFYDEHKDDILNLLHGQGIEVSSIDFGKDYFTKSGKARAASSIKVTSWN